MLDEPLTRSISQTSLEQSKQTQKLEKSSGQRVHFECAVYPLKQTELEWDEEFSRQKVLLLIDKYYRNKVPSCIMYFLDDQIYFQKTKLFGSKPFRNYVKIRDIKRCSTFKSKPGAFVLHVNSKSNPRKTYDIFRCKNQEDLIRIGELLERANQIQNSLFYTPELGQRKCPKYSGYESNEEHEMRVISLADLSPNLNGKSQSTNHLNSEILIPNLSSKVYAAGRQRKSVREESVVLSTDECYFSEEPVVYWSDPLEMYTGPSEIITSPPGFGFRRYSKNSTFVRAKLKPNLMQTPTDTVNWKDDITYVDNDPICGPKITDRGPVYLYSVRIETDKTDLQTD